jgi:hypothetical protein
LVLAVADFSGVADVSWPWEENNRIEEWVEDTIGDEDSGEGQAAVRGPSSQSRNYWAYVHPGDCSNLNSDESFVLGAVRVERTEDDRVLGAESALPIALRKATIDTSLSTLVSEAHSVQIRTNGAQTVACGDIGGLLSGSTLRIGLQEPTSDKRMGVVILHANGNSTGITVLLILE